MKIYQFNNKATQVKLRKQAYINGSSAPQPDYIQTEVDTVTISEQARETQQTVKLLMLDEQRKINELKYMKKLIADFSNEEDIKRDEIRKEVIKAAIRLDSYDYESKRAMQEITDSLTALLV